MKKPYDVIIMQSYVIILNKNNRNIFLIQLKYIEIFIL